MIKFQKKYRIESTRIPEYDYSKPNSYFITICSKNKINYFGEITNAKMILNETGMICSKFWEEIPLHFSNAQIDEFTIMPNHIHGIINIIEETEKNDEIKMDFEFGSRDVACFASQNKSDLRRDVACYVSTKPGIISFPKRGTISVIIRSFKSAVTKECRKLNSNFAWQERFYEHVIRNEKELYKIRNYIQLNPLKWDLDEENIINIKIP